MSIYIPCAILLLLFLYVNLTIMMNPLSSKIHFLAQTRQTKRRTNRTGRTENRHERANSAPKSRACADVIQLCQGPVRRVSRIRVYNVYVERLLTNKGKCFMYHLSECLHGHAILVSNREGLGTSL